MSFTVSCLFYLLIGGGVGTALFLDDKPLSLGERIFRSLSGILFWPLYLPLLLQPADPPAPTGPFHQPKPAPKDELGTAIAQVERELEAALGSLDGWAEIALADASERIDELRAAWGTQAERIRELDHLLARPEFLTKPPVGEEFLSVRSNGSEASRRENIARLHQVRKQMHEDLMGTLAWVRELVTMIHLAKFTGAPASRAEELIAQIAASVEGLTEVTGWNQDAVVSHQ